MAFSVVPFASKVFLAGELGAQTAWPRSSLVGPLPGDLFPPAKESQTIGYVGH